MYVVTITQMAVLDKVTSFLTFFSVHSPDNELLHGVGEPGVRPPGHCVACLMLRLLADRKWDIGILHVFGQRWDGGVVSRSDTELASRDDFDLLPGGVVVLAHDRLLRLDLGAQFGAV